MEIECTDAYGAFSAGCLSGEEYGIIGAAGWQLDAAVLHSACSAMMSAS